MSHRLLNVNVKMVLYQMSLVIVVISMSVKLTLTLARIAQYVSTDRELTTALKLQKKQQNFRLNHMVNHLIVFCEIGENNLVGCFVRKINPM